MEDISLVIPIYNESENLPRTVTELRQYPFFEDLEILLVYDESEDNTLGVAENLSQEYPSVTVLKNPYPKGFGWSIKAGLQMSEGEYAVIMMADLCDDPQTIPKMYSKAESGYDVVCGSRFMEGGEKIGGLASKTFFSKSIGLMVHHLTGLPTVDCTNSFRMYRREVVENIPMKCDLSFAISMQMVLSSYFQGYQITEIPTTWRRRKKGKSQFRISDMAPVYFRTFLWGIKKSFKNI